MVRRDRPGRPMRDAVTRAARVACALSCLAALLPAVAAPPSDAELARAVAQRFAGREGAQPRIAARERQGRRRGDQRRRLGPLPQLERAREVAGGVRGIVEIVDRTTVRGAGRPDAEILAAVRDGLRDGKETAALQITATSRGRRRHAGRHDQRRAAALRRARRRGPRSRRGRGRRSDRDPRVERRADPPVGHRAARRLGRRRGGRELRGGRRRRRRHAARDGADRCATRTARGARCWASTA